MPALQQIWEKVCLGILVEAVQQSQMTAQMTAQWPATQARLPW